MKAVGPLNTDLLPLKQHQTLAEHVYHRILSLIIAGELPPGSRLEEQDLAVALGVSRTPLREAIARLVKDGLVVHQPYRGNSIRSFTAKDAFDLYEVRKALEVMSVRLATPVITSDGIAKLRATTAAIDAALGDGDLVAYSLGDQQFHDYIASISNNQTLIELLHKLQGQIQLVRVIANRDPGILEITAMERPGIVDAMAARDVDQAAALMEEHISLVQNYVANLLTPHG